MKEILKTIFGESRKSTITFIVLITIGAVILAVFGVWGVIIIVGFAVIGEVWKWFTTPV